MCLTTYVFGQTKFDNDKLILVQEIYHKTNRANVDNFMKDKGFSMEEPLILDDSEYGDVLLYRSKFQEVQVDYHLNKKIQGVILTYAGAPNNIMIEMELEDAGYISKEDDSGDIKMNIWKKGNSSIIFITYADEKRKIGVVTYGTMSDD